MGSKVKKPKSRRKQSEKVWVEKTASPPKKRDKRKIRLDREFSDTIRVADASSDSSRSGTSGSRSSHKRADGRGEKGDTSSGTGHERREKEGTTIGPEPCSSRGISCGSANKRKREAVDVFDRGTGPEPGSGAWKGAADDAEGGPPTKQQRRWKVPPPKNFRGFAGKNDVLSNFYPCQLYVYGRTFRSTEHAYQWSKAICMGNRKAAEEILRAAHAGQAKRTANWYFRDVDLNDWIPWRVPVLKQLLRAKARCCPEFRDELRNTGDRYIAEVVPGEKYWGIGDGTGQNMMGKLLMQLRSHLDEALRADPEEDGRMIDFTQGQRQMYGVKN